MPRDRKRNLQPRCRSSTHLQHSQYVYSPLKAQELAARALAMPLAAVLWSVPVLTARTDLGGGVGTNKVGGGGYRVTYVCKTVKWTRISVATA
jgi:hypothetical protein